MSQLLELEAKIADAAREHERWIDLRREYLLSKEHNTFSGGTWSMAHDAVEAGLEELVQEDSTRQVFFEEYVAEVLVDGVAYTAKLTTEFRRSEDIHGTDFEYMVPDKFTFEPKRLGLKTWADKNEKLLKDAEVAALHKFAGEKVEEARRLYSALETLLEVADNQIDVSEEAATCRCATCGRPPCSPCESGAVYAKEVMNDTTKLLKELKNESQ